MSQPSTAPGLTRPRVVQTIAELRAEVCRLRQTSQQIGVVPTMGALHAGHLSLVEACCQRCDRTIVTIFVNPTQFGPGEDFERYPRCQDRDLELLSAYNVELVFAPGVDEVYPPGATTEVNVAGVTDRFEGAIRPGHFTGVATVVLKLFNMVTPDVAFFGQKDYQQTLVVRKLVADLNLPIEIVIGPTIREPDGLALSSRNAYLTSDQRAQAVALSQSLQTGAKLVAEGEQDVATVLRQMRAVLDQAAGFELDYLAIVDPNTLADVPQIKQPAMALVAAQTGATRLIDNLRLEPPGD